MLRHLLEETPEALQLGCANKLLDVDDRFNFCMNPTYPLTLNGRRVFLGYAMNVRHIHKALVDHLNGQNFFILCFPEQVPWYRMLFPGKTYL